MEERGVNVKEASRSRYTFFIPLNDVNRDILLYYILSWCLYDAHLQQTYTAINVKPDQR